MSKTTTYKTNHNTFGGVIYQSDFCTDYETTHNIAARIVSDWSFDKQCERNIELREMNQKYNKS